VRGVATIRTAGVPIRAVTGVCRYTMPKSAPTVRRSRVIIGTAAIH